MQIDMELLAPFLTETGRTYKELVVEILKKLKVSIVNPEKFINLFVPASCVLQGHAMNKPPFSCYLLECDDTLSSIMDTAHLAAALTTFGGGIGVNLSRIREWGAPVAGKGGCASGVVSAARVFEASVQFAALNESRGGGVCCYLDIDHPEIKDFLDIRKLNGSPERRAHRIHNAINISDKFMQAVKDDTEFELISRADGKVHSVINARPFFLEIIRTRLETGEPFIAFSDTIARHTQEIGYTTNGDSVSMSNLCTEILVKTRTAGAVHIGICCLGSLNLLAFDENYYDGFEEDLCAVFGALYKNGKAEFDKVIKKSPTLGLLLTKQLKVPLADKTFGIGVFNYALAAERDGAEDKILKGLETFYRKLRAVAVPAGFKLCGAIAPTSKISMLFHGTPCLEHFPMANCVFQDGSRSLYIGQGATNNVLPFQLDVSNRDYIDRVRRVQDCGIDQGISCNLYYDSGAADFSVKTVALDHIYAWEQGLRTLYYCRSKAVYSGMEACQMCAN
ncbi:MAG: hypothetical protein ACRCX2_10490 [Paraclostridium sp.]